MLDTISKPKCVKKFVQGVIHKIRRKFFMIFLPFCQNIQIELIVNQILGSNNFNCNCKRIYGYLYFNTKMGVAGLMFEPHPPNF